MSEVSMEAETQGMVWSDALDRWVHRDNEVAELKAALHSLVELETLKNG